MLNTIRFDEWECYKLSDCDFDKQCQGTPGRCIDPCTNDVNTGDDFMNGEVNLSRFTPTGRPPCGTGADCVATRYKAICSCPKTHTGKTRFCHHFCNNTFEVTHSSPAAPSPLPTCAGQTPAAPTRTASPGWTRGRGRTGQCVSATRASEVSGDY